jgi:hypothetical protein
LTLARDAEAVLLLEWLEQAGVTDLLDESRASVVGRAN